MADKTTRKASPGPFAKILRDVIDLSILFLCIATLMSWSGRFWWVADLSTHFTVYFVASAVVLLMAVLVQRRKRAAVVVLIILTLNTWTVLPTFWPGSKPSTIGAPTIRLAQVNLLHKNRDKDSALAFIRHCDADLMIIQELDPWWERVLKESDIPFKFVVSHPIDHSFGIALLAHESLDATGTILVEDADVLLEEDGFGRPTIEAAISLAGRRVKLLSIHPPPPMSSGLTAMRNKIIRQAKDWADEQTEPHIIIGDLNCTPWSYPFSILNGDGKLISSLNGRGNQGTWPTGLPMPWKLPIDHCLFSKQWACTARSIGPETGSDHLPLLVTLALDVDVPADAQIQAKTPDTGP